MTAPSFTSETFTAFRLPDGRRAGVCTEETSRCVHGHRIVSDTVVTSRSIVVCHHRPPRRDGERANANQGRCNTALLLTRMRFDGSDAIGDAGEQFWLVIEVSGEQLRHLKRIPMTALETLVFLGAGLPGTYGDMVSMGGNHQTRQR